MSCDYTGNDFGANYPDACCIDGFLWDLDSCDEPGGDLTHGGETPCPQCNHEAWLEGLEDTLKNEGYLASEKCAAREYPRSPEQLRFPEDHAQLREWWLAGYDEQKAEAAAEVEG